MLLAQTSVFFLLSFAVQMITTRLFCVRKPLRLRKSSRSERREKEENGEHAQKRLPVLNALDEEVREET